MTKNVETHACGCRTVTEDPGGDGHVAIHIHPCRVTCATAQIIIAKIKKQFPEVTHFVLYDGEAKLKRMATAEEAWNGSVKSRINPVLPITTRHALTDDDVKFAHKWFEQHGVIIGPIHGEQLPEVMQGTYGVQTTHKTRQDYKPIIICFSSVASQMMKLMADQQEEPEDMTDRVVMGFAMALRNLRAGLYVGDQ